MFGEADIPALLDSNPADVPDGSRPSHYSDAVINDWYGRFQSALGAIRAVNTDSKTVISISYLHYGFLTALKNKGLQWDIIGLDWYADMGEFSRVLTPVKANFTPGYSHHRNQYPPLREQHLCAAFHMELADGRHGGGIRRTPCEGLDFLRADG